MKKDTTPRSVSPVSRWTMLARRLFWLLLAVGLISAISSLALAQPMLQHRSVPAPLALAAPSDSVPVDRDTQVVTYSYDTAGRLGRAKYDDEASISYSYDAAGNLLGQQVVEGPVGPDLYLPVVLR
jgi:hypothetical protein